MKLFNRKRKDSYYSKLVVENLLNLSNELFSEFDRASDNCLLRSSTNEVGIIKRIREEYKLYCEKNNKAEMNFNKINHGYGIRIEKLINLKKKLISDPLTPKSLRGKIISYIDYRTKTEKKRIDDKFKILIDDLNSKKVSIEAQELDYYFQINLGWEERENLENMVNNIRDDIYLYLERNY